MAAATQTNSRSVYMAMNHLADFQRRMVLSDGWDWSDVECMINDGRTSSADVEDAIRAGLR